MANACSSFVSFTDMQTYPQAPYYEGRWSNGPTWIEIAARQLGVNLTDYGAAGATTGIVPARKAFQLLQTVLKIAPAALYAYLGWTLNLHLNLYR